MIHIDPEHRPSASELLQDPILVPHADKSKAQLRRELNTERFKCEMLARELEETKRNSFGGASSMDNSSRFQRSKSVTLF